MNPLLKEIRHSPMPRLLAIVPLAFAAAKLELDAHTWLLVLSFAICHYLLPPQVH